MRITEVTFDESRPVDGYGPGFFRVAGDIVEGGVLLLPSGLSDWAGYDALGGILDRAREIDVLLVGTGAEIAHLPARMRSRIEAAGIGIEAMATPAACRTYNVLIAEGRRVGAVLLPV